MTDPETSERLLQSDGFGSEDPFFVETEDPQVEGTAAPESDELGPGSEDPGFAEIEDPEAEGTAAPESDELGFGSEDPGFVEAEEPQVEGTAAPESDELSVSSSSAPASAPVAAAPTAWEGPTGTFDASEFAPTADEISPVVWAPTEDFSPVSAPDAFPGFPTTGALDTPTSALEEAESFVLNPFHLVLIGAIAGSITLGIFWKCCKSWKLKREKQMLRLQSTRVDAVLGDMQMVGMDDYNNGDDPELI